MPPGLAVVLRMRKNHPVPMQLNFVPTSFRLHAVDTLFEEIEARPTGKRKERMFDLKEELRGLRVEERYNVKTESWRWMVALDEQHSVDHNGERQWEPSLRREERLDEVRFPTREAAETALTKYLDAL